MLLAGLCVLYAKYFTGLYSHSGSLIVCHSSHVNMPLRSRTGRVHEPHGPCAGCGRLRHHAGGAGLLDSEEQLGPAVGRPGVHVRAAQHRRQGRLRPGRRARLRGAQLWGLRVKLDCVRVKAGTGEYDTVGEHDTVLMTA